MKKYAVVTETGCVCYETDCKANANQYVKQAENKGAAHNSLQIVSANDKGVKL